MSSTKANFSFTWKSSACKLDNFATEDFFSASGLQKNIFLLREMSSGKDVFAVFTSRRKINSEIYERERALSTENAGLEILLRLNKKRSRLKR